MAAGALVDDEIVCNAVASKIEELCTPQKHGESLILDGFPRTVTQARKLDRLLESLGMPGPLVLHLDVPSDVLLRRLALRRQCARCGAVYSLASSSLAAGASRCPLDGGALVERDDDSEGVIARRLAAYEAETLPVVDHYRGQGYRRIDGDRGPADIAREVREIVAFFTAIAVAA